MPTTKHCGLPQGDVINPFNLFVTIIGAVIVEVVFALASLSANRARGELIYHVFSLA